MTKLNFSQTVYPSLLKIGDQTICGITLPQLDSVNTIIVNYDECRELNDSLHSELKICEDLVKVQKEVISSQDKEIQIQKNIVIEKDKIIEIDKDINKKLERKAKWLKLQRNILAVGVIVLTGALLL